MAERIVKLNLNKESDHQRALFLWAQQPSVRRKYPELALLHHIKNETPDGAAAVAVDKAMGVRKGVPDLCMPVARGCYHGLYIELKTPKGRPSDEQLWWIDTLNEHGYHAQVCYGWRSAQEVVEWYLNLNS